MSNLFSGASRTVYSLTYKPIGYTYPLTVSTSSYGPYYGTKTKVGVTTGRFTPGVYRVNPYYVGSQHFVSEDDIHLQAEWEDINYKHKITTSGKLLTQFIWSNLTAPSVSLYEEYRKLAVTKAFAKLGRSQLQLGVELGELRETAHMLLHPLNSLHNLLEAKAQKGYRTLGKLIRYRETGNYGTITRGRSATKAARDSWMELRYGLRPLIKTISEVYDFLMNGHAVLASNSIRSVRSRLVGLDGQSTRTDTVQADSSQIWRIPVSIKTVDTVSALGVVLYRQNADVSLLSTLGLDLRYLPETAWELTSRSFVWDWFIGIGDSIRLLRQSPEITRLGATGSIKVTREVTCSAGRPYIASKPTVTCSTQAKAIARYIMFDRQVDQKPSYLPIFHGTSNLDTLKVLDLISMKHTDMTKRVRKYLTSY